MPKHNKKRNTVFIYEALMRELTKEIIIRNKNKRDKIVSIIKEHFNKEKLLNVEMQLYKNLLDTEGLSPKIAEKLIQESKREYEKLDRKKIFTEQSALIKIINKELSNKVFSNFVPNYKDLATLSQIFGEDIGAKKRVMLEENLLNKLVSKENNTKKNGDTKMSNLVVSKFIEKFNFSYDKKLNENQKTFFKKYILSSLTDEIDFKVYLNEEIGRLKIAVNESFKVEEVAQDNGLISKMKEIKILLENFNKKVLDTAGLLNILKIQKLVEEVNK